MHISYWAPFFDKIATVKSVKNSIKSILIFNKSPVKIDLLNFFGEWSENKIQNSDNINSKLNYIDYYKKGLINKLPKNSFFKSRVSYIVLFFLGIFPLINYLKKNKIKLISLTKEKSLIKKLSSTAELAFGMTLNSVRNIYLSSQSVKKGNWTYLPFIGRMMKNLNICTIGYGRLGKIYAKYCLNFGAKVFTYDPYIKIKNKRVKIIKNLQKELNRFDVISLNIHATKTNINFLNKNLLNCLKKNVIIINTSRGEVVNERHLLSFLKKNRDAQYSADVISGEQKNYQENIMFKKFKKKTNQILLTPHIGGMTSDGQKMAYNHALDMLISFDKQNV